MPVFVVRHRDGRDDELVDADACIREGSFWVLRASMLVVNMPRDVVVRRLSAREVEVVESIRSTSAGQPTAT